MKRIRLLGEPAILDEAGEMRPVRGHQAWALLARVLLARGPVDRRSLAAELFPETADPLGALRWCLAALRGALDEKDCLRGDPVEAALPDDIRVDLFEIEDEAFDAELAGPLLGGSEPRASSEFATWLLVERERLGSAVQARLRRDILRALAIGDTDRSIRLAERIVRRDPFDESGHILLVKSLALAGHHEAALQHVEATDALFLAEFGERPSAALRSAARRSVEAPPAGIAPATFVQSAIQSGRAALAAGAVDAGIDMLRRSVAGAERIADRPLTAQAMFELGTALVHSLRGHDDEGSVMLRRAAELAQEAGIADLAASCFRELGYVEALAGRRPAAAAYLAQAANFTSNRDSLAGIHAVIGYNLVDWGRIDEGLQHQAVAVDYARSSRNRRREIWSLGVGAWGLMAAERLDEADQWASHCLRLVEEDRWIAFQPWPVAILHESRLRRGAKPAQARPALEAAFALSCQLADPCWQGATARTLALGYAAENDFARAAEWIADARRRCIRDIDPYAALEVVIVASEVELLSRQNQVEAAGHLAREWVALAARAHMDGHVARAARFIAGG